MNGPIWNRATATPYELAIVDSEKEWTWQELAHDLRLAVSAITNLGIAYDERVAVLSSNSGEATIAYLAGLHAGVSMVPVNWRLTADEVAYILNDSNAAAILCDAPRADVARTAASLAGVGTVIAWGAPPVAGLTGWQGWLAASESAPSLDFSRFRPVSNLLYTSGTTGFPKGVQRPFPADLPDTVTGYLDLLAATSQAGAYLVVGPLYHTGPQQAIPMLGGGRPLIVMGRFDAETVLQAIEQHQVTGALMVPTHFVRLLDLPSDVRAKFDVSSLRIVHHTGSSCPGDVKRALIEWWGPILEEAYGGTEAGTVCSISSAEWALRPGSVGRPTNRFAALVLDDDGQQLPSGQPGQLYFEDLTGRGISYHNDPDKSAAAHLRPGVFTLGEIGYIDAEGYVYITDRFSDLVVSGGVNLYPAEAERVLQAHPSVVDIAVIGVPDADMGEQLKALVITSDPELAESAVLEWCRARLSHHKCPRTVEFVDTLGRTPMGKLNKRELRRPYWDPSVSGQ